METTTRTQLTPGRLAYRRSGTIYEFNLATHVLSERSVILPDAPNLHFSQMTGPKKANILELYRPVSHVTRHITIGGVIGSPHGEGELEYIVVPGGAIESSIPTRVVYGSALSFFSEMRYAPPDVRQWPNRANQAHDKIHLVKPSLNQGFSLANFLFQYKDLFDIVKHWQTNLGFIKEYHRFQAKYSSLPDKARFAAGEVLQHQYGTKLFIRDLQTIYRIIGNWKSNVDKLVAGAYAHQTSNVRVDAPILHGLSSPSYKAVSYVPFGGHPDGLLVFRSEYAYRSNASVVYHYTLPPIKGFICRLAQLSDSFGVGLDASIVWDAIPFTFVLDWFVNVGEYLHSARVDWYDAAVTYTQFGVSAKESITRTIDYDVNGVIQNVCSDTYSLFERRLRQLPDKFLPAPSIDGGWRINRIINATALAVQQLTKPRGPREPPLPIHKRIPRPKW